MVWKKKKLPTWAESITVRKPKFSKEFLEEQEKVAKRAKEVMKYKRKKENMYRALGNIEKAFGDVGVRYRKAFEKLMAISESDAEKEYGGNLRNIISRLFKVEKQARISAGRTTVTPRQSVRTYGRTLEKFVEKGADRLEREHRQRLHPNLFRTILKYISGRHSRRRLYLVLLALFLVFLAFRNKGITGYSVLETVTNNNYLSYFLVFVLIVCLFAFYKLNKK